MPSRERYQNRIELLRRALDVADSANPSVRAPARIWHQPGHQREFQRAPVREYGSSYSALHRLEKQKLVAADLKLSENNQRIKVHRLAAAGKEQLSSEHSPLSQLTQAMAGILSPKQEESEI